MVAPVPLYVQAYVTVTSLGTVYVTPVCPVLTFAELVVNAPGCAATGLTVIVTVLELAVLVVKQVAVEVIVQAIASLFAKAALVYVALLVPTLLPFFVHW